MRSGEFRKINGIIALVYDISMIPIAWMLAYWMRFNLADIPFTYLQQAISTLAIIILAQIIFFKIYGLHRGVWRFASIPDIIRILKASGFGVGFALLLVYVSRHDTNLFHGTALPLTIPILYGLLLIGLLSISRFILRFFKDYKRLFTDYKKVIIVGAGKAGEGLARELLRADNHPYKPIAFVDDDLNKLGREIHGIRVEGITADLIKLIAKHEIDLVLIAMPSAPSASLCSVVENCEKAGVICYTLPSIQAIAEGHISVNALRNISLEDLLGRYEINLNQDAAHQGLINKTILVTGGGGSIGAELCRQLASIINLTRLIIVDHNEHNLYQIERELSNKVNHHNFVYLLLSVTDRIGMREIFSRYKPNIIFHAAAYKHVPLLEYQVRSAIYNNVIGTRVLAEEAAMHDVESFILISSDKAVNPSSIMGATKRAAEYFCQSFNRQNSGTRFITVRFGNVLDSTGSVVPLFRKQIEMGGPVTVTHPEIMRFFMTIPEAAQLILQAAVIGKGGEIFVLDMGNPIKIRFLAEQMIKLAGKTVDKDIKIVYTGLRAGEKLYEECFYAHEHLQPTRHSKIMQAISHSYDFIIVNNICNRMETAYRNNDNETLLTLLKTLVIEYNVKSIQPHITEPDKVSA